jgi:hypothetical protein
VYILIKTTSNDISFLVEEGTASTGVSLGRARLLNLPLAIVQAVVQNIPAAGCAILLFF